MTEIEYTDEFEVWWEKLTAEEQASIDVLVCLLNRLGTSLDYPYSSQIKGSKYGNMRELRIQHKGEPYRVFYAFGPMRSVILLLGARKVGYSDKEFYAKYISVADKLYSVYLEELEQEGLG